MEPQRTIRMGATMAKTSNAFIHAYSMLDNRGTAEMTFTPVDARDVPTH